MRNNRKSINESERDASFPSALTHIHSLTHTHTHSLTHTHTHTHTHTPFFFWQQQHLSRILYIKRFSKSWSKSKLINSLSLLCVHADIIAIDWLFGPANDCILSFQCYASTRHYSKKEEIIFSIKSTASIHWCKDLWNY